MEKKNIYNLLTKYNFVVPEIQREYVWGNNKSVVETFVIDLAKGLAKGDVNIGFLYSYKNGSEYHIIDGQQRLTTIILLLHVLSSQNETLHNEFKKNILRLQDTLPAFAYRVRDTTISFMNHLFDSTLIDINEIKQQKWFKLAYENDVTISSILNTIKIFEDLEVLKKLDFMSVLDHVTFWYFSVEQTSQGEELYITMNSRGEKLTDNEQLKPRLFSKLNDASEKETYGKLWDNWEEFFYKYRNFEQKKRNIVVIDKAMNNVIRITLELITGNEHYTIKAGSDENMIDLNDLKSTMDAIIHLKEYDNLYFSQEIDRLYGDSENDNDFFVLKALIIESIKGQNNFHEFERVYHTIKNQVLRHSINHKDLLNFLKFYRKSSKTFYEYFIEAKKLIFTNTNSQELIELTKQELEKVSICNEQGETAESNIWGVQETNFWKGNIQAMLDWSKTNDKFSVDEFVKVHEKFILFFKENQEKDCTSDNIRRAFLCLGLRNYPIDDSNFGYTRDEWIKIFMNNKEIIKNFITGIQNSESVENYCNKFIEQHDPSMNWAEFVEEPELLDYINTKHIWWDDKYGHILVKNTRARPISVKAMHIYIVLKNHWNDICCSNYWKLWYYTNLEHPCAVIDNQNYALDILYERKEENQYYIVQMFKRDENVNTETELRAIATRFDFEFDSNIERYSITLPFDDNKIIQLVRNMYSNSLD